MFHEQKTLLYCAHSTRHCPGRGHQASAWGHRPAGSHLWPVTCSHVMGWGHTHGCGPTVGTANRGSTTPFLGSPTRPAVYDYHCRKSPRERDAEKIGLKRDDAFSFLYNFSVIFLPHTRLSFLLFLAGFATQLGEDEAAHAPFTAVGCQNSCSYWMMGKGSTG